jgi:hypothetical protein
MKGVDVTTEESVGWIFGAAASIIATLASAVAFMFKLNESKNAEAIKKLETGQSALQTRCDILDKQNDDCVKDRDLIRVKLAEVETELKFVKSQTMK